MSPRYLAPAGAPISAADLTRWGLPPTGWAAARADVIEQVAALTARRRVELTSTGRAGLSLLLRAIGRSTSTDRDEVILPSYTCYSVAAAAVRAGLRPRIVDIDPRTLDFDLERLSRADFRRVAAIVVTNLYGLPGNLPRLVELAAERGSVVIDDAAQSLGAEVGGIPSGGWGTAGLVSFDKGKPISAIDGGAVVTDSDALADAVRARVSRAGSRSLLGGLAETAKVLTYAAFLRPSLYWIPAGLPGTGLGQTKFEPECPETGPSKALTALARTMLPRLQEFNDHRVAVAGAIWSQLEGVPGIQTVVAIEGSRPIYSRFPLLAEHHALREALLTALRKAGIGATASYPTSIADIPALAPYLACVPDAAAGRHVAERIITLPTHAYVQPADVVRMAKVIRRCTETSTLAPARVLASR